MIETGTSAEISHIVASDAEADTALHLDPFAAVPSGEHQLWWLIVLVLACVGSVIVSAQFSQDMDSFFPEAISFPSVYNKKPSGYSGFFEILQKAGFRCAKWEQPYRNLRSADGGVMLMIAPQETPTESDYGHLLDWVKKGNTVIYLDYFTYRTGRRLLEKVGINCYEGKTDNERVLTIAKGLPEAKFVKDVMVSGDVRLTGGTALIADETSTFLTRSIYGKGQVLIGSMPSFCANRRLQHKEQWGNFQFLSNCIEAAGAAGPKRKIMFDEKCHGFSSQTNILVFLAKTPVGLFLLQLLIIGLVALVSFNQRFGMAISIDNRRTISNLEFIEGLAATYRRAKASDTVWSMIFHSFKARLCKTLQVAPHESSEHLAAEWALATGQNKAECEAFLIRAQTAFDGGRISKEELLALVTTCDRLRSNSRTLLTTSSSKS